MPKLIVSCTTTKARLNFLYYMLVSLQQQTVRPDRVLVNISRDPYLDDEGIVEVPNWLNRFDCDINWVPNFGPYRKLLPALTSASSDDRVVTADDDVLYDRAWLESLVCCANQHPDKIVAARARLMRRTPLGGWQNYHTWPLATRRLSGLNLMPTGAGGVLYRKRLLDHGFITDKSFLKLAPRSDDLWFRAASLRKGTEVYADPSINERNIYLVHGLGLKVHNMNQKKSLMDQARLHSVGYLKSCLGINDSENDRAWDRIRRWSEKGIR